MSKTCVVNCLICGKCATFPILDSFNTATIAIETTGGHGIAVDIGTSTVVLTLVDLATGAIAARHSFLNPQREFGSDVISRIDAANNGHLTRLNVLITESVTIGICELLRSANVPREDIMHISIAANTVMTYILLGFDCKSLGVAPFIPEFALADSYNTQDVFSGLGVNLRLSIMPWLAAYVGGDITAGLCHVLAENTPKQPFLLVDLGTNGEIALWTPDKLIVTSTAAGPAFEAGHGGAGGVISALAGLLRDERVDETGSLEEGDNLPFTQKQIRDLQLAKSAVRTGLEIVIKEAGLDYDGLDAVYLAGGIGQAININDAVDIGLIPRRLADRTRAAGNTALGGAVGMLLTPKATEDCISKIAQNAVEINLAAHPDFNNYFMEYMLFEAEE